MKKGGGILPIVVGGIIGYLVIRAYGDYKYARGAIDAGKVYKPIIEIQDVFIDMLSVDKEKEEA